MKSTEAQTTRVDPPTLPAALRLCVLGASSIATHPLTIGGSITLGRSEQADVRIDDGAISRIHVRLSVVDGGRVTLEDLGSANGTWRSGVRLPSNAPIDLAPGELVVIGSTSLIVVGAAHVARTRSSTSAPPDLVERVAASEISVLVLGETGAGKEVLAQRLHSLSRRKDGPFVALNCAALSETLAETELFGHERGAFTGAGKKKLGLLKLADGGTLFLDEIGEMPLKIQAKLLRALETRTILPVGGIEAQTIDVRIISATNRDLSSAIAEKTFREDLFFRINGFTLLVPPLRDRRDEIADLALAFATNARPADAVAISITDQARLHLEAYAWPGNVRELKNVIEQALVLAGDEGPIDVQHLPADRFGERPLAPAPMKADDEDEDDEERQRVMKALEQCGGNQTRAAQLLGISRRTLVKRLDAYALPRPRKNTRS